MAKHTMIPELRNNREYRELVRVLNHIAWIASDSDMATIMETPYRIALSKVTEMEAPYYRTRNDKVRRWQYESTLESRRAYYRAVNRKNRLHKRATELVDAGLSTEPIQHEMQEAHDAMRQAYLTLQACLAENNN